LATFSRKNSPPSSRNDWKGLPWRLLGGAAFLEKVAKQYANKGEKSFNFGQYNNPQGRSSVCINRQNYNGYTFGRFRCPLPPGTGMNQLDQFCCGIANYQYCCNEQEYNREQFGGYGDNTYLGKRPFRNSYYSSSSRTLAIVLPIVGILVVAGAVIIVYFYYKKVRNAQNINGISSITTRLNDKYKAVPQEPPVEKPVVPPREKPAVPPREQRNTTVQA